MAKKVCCDCVHRINNPNDSPEAIERPRQWKCRKHWWQDISMSIHCSDGNQTWANRCKHFERDDNLWKD